jgi:hypothetical protein
MNRQQIKMRARLAGFPPPRFEEGRGIITVPILEAAEEPRPGATPAAMRGVRMTASQFNRACGPNGHAAVARFLNELLGTRYDTQRVYQWRTGRVSVPDRVANLVRGLKGGKITIGEGVVRLAKQECEVEQLRRFGRNAAEAERALGLYRDTLRAWQEHRRLIEEAIVALEQRMDLEPAKKTRR